VRGIRGSALVAVTAVAVLGGGGRPAAAQDVRVEVRLPAVIVRDVHRIVHAAIGAGVAREIRDAVRGVTTDMTWLAQARGAAGDPRGQFPVERDTRDTRTLRLGSDGWLDLTNVTGDISVTAVGGTTATVEIHRVSRGRTEADALRGLEQVQVEVSERGSRASIEARYPQERNAPYRVSVAYVVRAPRGTRIAIKSIAGAITTKGMQGDQTIDVVSGNVHVTDAGRIGSAKTIAGSVTVIGAETDGTIEVGSAAGSVTLRDIKARRVHASVVTGNIAASAIACTDAELSSMAGAVDFDGPLSARGHYNIQSYSGAIRFTVTGRIGFDLRAETFAGTITVDPPLTQTTAVGQRRSVRRTLGDGGAAVVLQTFSGTIAVVRK
jgi:hypothetical protein